jgi:putative peptide zinc metalloprotease protein
MSNSKQKAEPTSLADAMKLTPRKLDASQLTELFQHNRVAISLVAAFGIILSLPYQFHVGGKAEVLAVERQKIQAQVSGRISEIYPLSTKSGVIPRGKVIAQLESPELVAKLSKVKEEIITQQANKRAETAKLYRLINTPQSEDVAVAKSEVEIAKGQLRVAEIQLITFKTRAAYSSSEAARFMELHQQGAISLQLVEDSRRQAEIDAGNVNSQLGVIEGKRLEVVAAEARLNSVLIGPPPEDIQAAREQVAAVEGSIQVLDKEKRYLNDQIKRTGLTMPFDGFLTTSDLETKVGSYLQQGDTFAEAELARGDRMLVRVQVPEIMVDQLTNHSAVEVKLLAYPNQPFSGKVSAIQPSAKPMKTVERQAERSGDTLTERENNSGRVVEVLVDVEDPYNRLKPGMTGYAKIDGERMPVSIVFTRAIWRFITVEVWSWLP